MKIKDRIKIVLNAGDVYPEDITLHKGLITVRKSFFYTMGGSALKWEGRVNAALTKAGVTFEIVEVKEKYVAFRGGDTVRQGSHWAATFLVIDWGAN
jgi:hypothetical protein